MRGKRLQQVSSLAIGIFCAALTYHVYSEFSQRWEYLIWDPAAHAWNGIKIAADLLQLNPVALIRDTNEQVLWPPLHSYLQAPFHWIFGFDFHAAAICSLTFYAAFFLCITLLYQQLSEDWSGWVVLMSFTATSPYYAGFGATPMLEIFGATLTAFAASLHLKKSKWFPLSLSLLFFLKYNYFVYLALPVFLPDFIRMIKTLSIRNLTGFLLTPFRIFVILYCSGLFLIQVTGGFAIGRLSLQGIGNPAYVLLLILFFRALYKKQHILLWSRIRGTGWEWFVIPVLIWMLIPVPNRVRSFLAFAVNKPMGPSPGELDYYLYYFQHIPLYFADHWIALLCCTGAVITAFLKRQQREISFLSLFFAISFLLMTVNQNKQERYLFTYVFSIWVLFSYGMTLIPQRIFRYLVLVVVTAILLASYNGTATRAVVRWPFAPVTVRHPVAFIVKHSADASEIRLLGVTNELNPSLIEYHVNKLRQFKDRPDFERELEREPPPGACVIAVNQESIGELIKRRDFGDSLQIRVYRTGR